MTLTDRDFKVTLNSLTVPIGVHRNGQSQPLDLSGFISAITWSMGCRFDKCREVVFDQKRYGVSGYPPIRMAVLLGINR